jgi:iron(III) transport system substrate-binding protein
MASPPVQPRYWRPLAVCLAFVVCAGCAPQPENSVVIYSAADREYAAPILSGFQRRQEAIEVLPTYDVEATKSVGLAARIESERRQPRGDVFWNNEIMQTLRLDRAGLLQSINWEIPGNWPSNMRSPDDTWVGIAARARVLLVNRDLLSDPSNWPDSVSDLAEPEWQGRCAFARPLQGTTAMHFSVLIDQLGESNAEAFFNDVANNAVLVADNREVAQAVASGEVAFGLTDSDDALIEVDSGLPVEIVFPDQKPGEPGTLRIPNTIAVLRDCPHPVAASELANYLVGSDTEKRLAMGPSGQFPVRPGHPQKSRAQQSQAVRWMDADFARAAQRWPDLAERFRAMFREAPAQ